VIQTEPPIGELFSFDQRRSQSTAAPLRTTICSHGSGIGSNQSCKWGIEWDICAPGLSCRFASERTLHFRWPPSANVGLDGVIYSDRVSNLLMYLGAESAVSSENPLKSLRIRADFDSTMRRFESSRPSQDLANQIRRFLNFPGFRSGGRDRLVPNRCCRPARQTARSWRATRPWQSLACRDGPDLNT
jgi:hypothetical protein